MNTCCLYHNGTYELNYVSLINELESCQNIISLYKVWDHIHVTKLTILLLDLRVGTSLRYHIQVFKKLLLMGAR